MTSLFNYALIGTALTGSALLGAEKLSTQAQNAQKIYQTVQARASSSRLIDGFQIKEHRMYQGSNTYYLATFDVVNTGVKVLQVSVQRDKNDRIIFTDRDLDGIVDTIYLHVEDSKNSKGIKPGLLPLTDHLQRTYISTLSNTVLVIDQQQQR